GAGGGLRLQRRENGRRAADEGEGAPLVQAGPDLWRPKAQGHKTPGEVRGEQAGGLAGGRVVGGGGVVDRRAPGGEALSWALDHLLRQVEAERLHSLAAQGLEPSQKGAGADAHVEDVERPGVVPKDLLLTDLVEGPLQRAGGDPLRVAVVMGRDHLVILPLD